MKIIYNNNEKWSLEIGNFKYLLDDKTYKIRIRCISNSHIYLLNFLDFNTDLINKYFPKDVFDYFEKYIKLKAFV